MGLSRLSEKCQKCNQKDTCDDKRMEACGYISPTLQPLATGGMVAKESLFINHNNNYEIPCYLFNKPFPEPTDEVIKAICKAVACTVKGSVM